MAETHDKRVETHACNLISRQAALDAVINLWADKPFGNPALVEIKDCIEALPPAQPVAKDINVPAKDCISRAQAIEAIKEDKIDLTDPNVVAVFKATEDFEKVETQVMTCDRHIKILKGLPSAQQERKKGQWIYHPEIGWGDTWLCDQCGEKTTSTVMGKPRANYCPMCGADMRGKQDE